MRGVHWTFAVGVLVGVIIGVWVGYSMTNRAWIKSAELNDAGREVWFHDKGQAFKVFEWNH